MLVVAIALVIGMLWLQEADIGDHQQTLAARFREVGNVRPGNPVVIRGVRSGRIEGIHLAEDGWVRLEMTVDRGAPMPPDPVVLLSESSLFGEWQATIADRSALPDDPELRRQVEIASRVRGILPGATRPGFGELTAVAGQIAGNVASVAERVQVAFDDSAARAIRGSIDDVAELSRTLAGTVREHAHDLDTLSSALRRALGSIERTARVTEGLAGRVDSASRSPGIRRAMDDLAAASHDLRRTATLVHDLTGRFLVSQVRLDQLLVTSDSLARKVNGRDGTLGLLVNDAALYRNADSLLIQLRRLVVDVRANPRRYFSVSIF